MPALPERRDWFSLEDAHRHALATRGKAAGTFVQTLAPARNGEATDEWEDWDEYEDSGLDEDPDDIIIISDSEESAQETDDDDNDADDVIDLDQDEQAEVFQDSDDEFGGSDAEFEEILAKYDESTGNGDAVQVADTCGQVESIVSEVEVEVRLCACASRL